MYNKEEDRATYNAKIKAIYDKYYPPLANGRLKFDTEEEFDEHISRHLDIVYEMVKAIDYDRSDKLKFVLHMADCLPIEDLDAYPSAYFDDMVDGPLLIASSLYQDVINLLNDDSSV